jgi:hypothetical protein
MAAPDRLYDTAAFCALEPPAPVEFDIAEIPRHIGDIVSIGPFALKMQQWAEAKLWDTYCECLSNEIAEGEIIMDETYGPFPASPTTPYVFASTKQFPAGTTMSVASVLPTGGSGYDTSAAYEYGGAPNWWNRTIPPDGFVATPQPVGYVMPSLQPVYFTLRPRFNAGGMRVVIRGYQPSTAEYVPPSEPIAPPELPTYEYPACDEEDLCARLNDLDARLQIVNGYVQLVQRQIVPFASVPGTNRPGLAGSGTFVVQGILGLSVDITTLPSAYGQLLANPTLLIDIGWIAIGNADGWLPAHRIQHDKQLIFPENAAMLTQVAYHLRPGVVVSILEIHREA